MGRRLTYIIAILIALTFLSSCAFVRKPTAIRGRKTDEDAVREFAKTYGFDEDVARFYLNHPEYIRRYYSPPAYHSRNYRIKTHLFGKYFDMAMEYKRAGDLDMAIETFRRALRVNPKSATVMYNLGILYFEKGMIREAIEWYRKTLSMSNSVELIVDSYINLAICYLKMGKLGDAENHLIQAAELAPDHPDLIYNLGVVYLEMGKHEKATEQFRRCLDVDGLAPDARMGLGLCYAGMNRRKEALGEFEEVAKIRPSDPQVWYNIGVLSFELRDFERSKEAFQKAENLGYKGGGIREFLKAIAGMRTREARMAYNEGVSHQEAGRYEEALSSFEKALELDPNLKETYLNMAFCLSQLGRSDRAVETLKRALEIDRDFFEANFNLGVIYLETGRPKKAIAPLRKAVRLKPNFAEGRYNLGIALYRSRKFKGAAEEFEMVTKLAPWWDDAHYNLAMSYLKLSRREDAVSELKSTLRVNPFHWKAGETLRSLRSVEVR
jgi:tetratricopeptide (TPR) repeat protein